MQWSFRPYRRDVRAAVERMIEWMPEKIVIAHGRCYESEGVRELQRAFRWVL
jgi:Ni,Fe-hydrogenase III small subunit